MTLDPLPPPPPERGPEANRRLAERCRQEPSRLSGIVAWLAGDDPTLAAVGAEVLVMVAVSEPALVAPFGESLVDVIRRGAQKPRWEAMHALSLIAPARPDLIAPLLPDLLAIVRADPSVIARDKATETIANYAGSSPAAAAAALPLLIAILPIDNGRFASRSLEGLRLAVQADPDRTGTIFPIAAQHLDHHRGVARTAAKRLLRQIDDL